MPWWSRRSARPEAEPERRPGSSLGTAHWTKAPTGWSKGKIWLGRTEAGEPVAVDDNRHIVTVAGSRAGKGTTAIIPNLCLWPGSVVVIDPKGENARRTARARQNRLSPHGHEVVVLDPFGTCPETIAQRGCLNPLDLIDAEKDSAVELSAAIADGLVMSGDQRDAHWDESARAVIEGLILLICCKSPAEQRNLHQVRYYLTRGSTAMADYYDEIAPLEKGSWCPFEALWQAMADSDASNEHVRDVIAGGGARLQAMGTNERGSVLSTAQRNTKFLDSGPIKSALAASSFSLDALKASPGGVSLYLCLPASYLPTHARLLRLVLNLLFQRMESLGADEKGETGYPVLFVLDEMAALGRMEVIQQAAGLMAGYGVKLWTILQDLSQLKRHYKDGWETFLGNAGIVQLFANTDLTTLEWASKRLGEREVSFWTKTVTSSTARPSEQQRVKDGASGQAWSILASDAALTQGENYGESRQTRPLLRPDEIARAFAREQNTQILLIGGEPTRCLRTAYFSDPQFKDLYDELPSDH